MRVGGLSSRISHFRIRRRRRNCMRFRVSSRVLRLTLFDGGELERVDEPMLEGLRPLLYRDVWGGGGENQFYFIVSTSMAWTPSVDTIRPRTEMGSGACSIPVQHAYGRERP